MGEAFLICTLQTVYTHRRSAEIDKIFLLRYLRVDDQMQMQMIEDFYKLQMFPVSVYIFARLLAWLSMINEKATCTTQSFVHDNAMMSPI